MVNSNKEHYLLPQQRNKSKGIKTYYGGIVKNGVTRWVSLKTKNYTVAMEWFNKSQAARFSPKEEQNLNIPLDKAINSYLTDLEKVRRRETSTIVVYTIILKQFETWCKEKGQADIDKITASLCLEYAREELAKKAGGTARRAVVTLRSFFKWVAQSYDITLRNPFTGVVTAKPKAEPREFWTLEECEKIIEAASDEEYKCWFALMAYAGLRKEEARHLKTKNIEGGKISLIGKGGKIAVLPISSRLKNYLDKYLTLRGNEPGELFPTLSAKGNNQDYYLIKTATKASVTNAATAHYHRFRHSFASNLLRKGTNIKAVQMLMRHENVTLTLNIYGHLLPSDLEKEVEL
ncbi:MAG: tyrosine-type recombinase/integrase [Fibromonadaceae bacterium]|jgi:site-specific recombinase XerD|nr:tyrosine-type recombinase/integrase [Fibromonadaceae bacterium]